MSGLAQRAYMMDEIAHLPGVGYVMTGKVSTPSNGFFNTDSQTVYQNSQAFIHSFFFNRLFFTGKGC
jgi:hypothetical protein